MNTWNLRTEILALSHRWFWVVASFLLGALLGWLVSLLWPAPYRATLDLYVGLNAYRTTRDLYVAQVAEEKFRSLDDYKNWQMGQLDSLAFSDEYLAETLNRLQAQDAAWQNVDVSALRARLALAWRNTGDWHFSAQASTPALAAQAVTVWSQVITEKTAASVDAARQMVMIDSQLREISRTQVDLETRQILLQETNLALADWMNYFASASSDVALAPAEYWTLLSQVTTAASWNYGWLPVLKATPPLGSPPADYQTWLTQVIALIEAELAVLPNQIAALQPQSTELFATYNVAADQSSALSANLEVAQIKEQAPQLVHLRPLGTLLLVGGLLGVLSLIMGWLVQITRKSN